MIISNREGFSYNSTILATQKQSKEKKKSNWNCLFQNKRIGSHTLTPRHDLLTWVTQKNRRVRVTYFTVQEEMMNST